MELVISHNLHLQEEDQWVARIHLLLKAIGL